MGQGDVLKILKKNKEKWMTAKELAKSLGITSVNNSLKKLFEQTEILRREIMILGNYHAYQYKIK